ncbi:LysE family translocator [Fodinicurvata fenggangensis]|uniref:LysE family translocator n=1 Tax=Fodinicurvata fenggangensis TaxID=1121830 RepID=UPI00047B64CF|nr:LysE family translocator [Fodinicurvata fenggangensis]
MGPLEAILAFTLAAALLTLTPGIDTALVLRTALVENARSAILAGLGVSAGVLAWGVLAAVGLGAVLAVSETAYNLVRIAGALYLLYLGALLIRTALRKDSPRSTFQDQTSPSAVSGRRWFMRGALTNLLNPKVGVFYVSFLPQFLPADSNVLLFSVLLAAIHAGLGVLWFAFITLATRPAAGFLRRAVVARTLDGITGSVLIAFGLRIAFTAQG